MTAPGRPPSAIDARSGVDARAGVDARSATGAPGVVPVRAAATVVLARDGDHPARPLEVLLLRRRADSGFVPGAHVFPGGALDPDDAHLAPPEGARLTGAAAAAALGLADPGVALAHWVAAVRETFEECGALLAHRPGAGLVDPTGDPALVARLARHRSDVDGGTRSLAHVLADEGLVPAFDHLRYLARWITPLGAPRRYDTRFFVARAPAGHDLGPDGREVTDLIWSRPADALEAHRAGTIDLILPTQRTLELLARFAAVDDLLRAVPLVADGHHVAEPGGGWRVPLAGDPVDGDPLADGPLADGPVDADPVDVAGRASSPDPATTASRGARP